MGSLVFRCITPGASPLACLSRADGVNAMSKDIDRGLPVGGRLLLLSLLFPTLP
jgi:hypothetical protein